MSPRPAIRERDAIDVVLDLNIGDAFVLRGREYMVARYGGCTHGADRIGQYFDARVFRAGGGDKTVRVRPNDKIELL